MPVRPRHCNGHTRLLITPLTYGSGRRASAARSQETTPFAPLFHRSSGEDWWTTRDAMRRASSALRAFSSMEVPVLCFRRALRLRVVAFALRLQCMRERDRAAPSARADDFGTRVSIAAQPRRIVSLNPTTTEMLFAIGAGTRLVGRSKYDAFPESAHARPEPRCRAAAERRGDARARSPISSCCTRARTIAPPPSVCVRPASPRWRSSIDSIAQFERDTRLLGRLTGDSASRGARSSIPSRATLDRVRARDARRCRVRRCSFHLGPAAHRDRRRQLPERAASRSPARATYTRTSSGAVGASSRSKMSCGAIPTSCSPVRSRRQACAPIRGGSALPAVRDGHVLAFDTTVVGRPSVTLGAAARSIADLLHPGAVR